METVDTAFNTSPRFASVSGLQSALRQRIPVKILMTPEYAAYFKQLPDNGIVRVNLTKGGCAIVRIVNGIATEAWRPTHG